VNVVVIFWKTPNVPRNRPPEREARRGPASIAGGRSGSRGG
jgi:hypothetical protein